MRQPKTLRELGPDPNGTLIKMLDGRYGPYVTDGETNASVPKGTDPNSVTLELALELIKARAAAGPRKKKKAKKKAAKKKTAKKATKKVAKKASKKAAKKPASDSEA
ncbi:MAG: topoisomerase C-terminal repeat-containing protein [Planctomycetota bacterium]|jgi:DNA topoisomerase-1